MHFFQIINNGSSKQNKNSNHSFTFLHFRLFIWRSLSLI